MTAVSAPAPITAAVAKWWWQATGVLVAATWVGIALAGNGRVPPLAAAAAAGTAALAAAPALSVRGVPGVTGLLALLALPVAVAEASRGGNAAPLGAIAGAVALLAALRAARARDASVSSVATVVGVGAVVTGLASGSLEVERVRFAVTDRPSAAVVLAGAALVLAAIDQRASAERAVFAPILLAAVLAAPVLPPLAVILAWGALATVAALVHRPAAALGALAIAASAAGVPPAALLLGAGAVLAAALDSRIAALCGLPGAVALADALSARPTTAIGVTTALALGATALALILSLGGGVRVDGGRPVALALALWLSVAPGSWAFTGAHDLGAYDAGATRAVATGLLVALVALFRRGGEFMWTASADREVISPDGMAERPAMAALLAVAATVASVGWLVVSVVRLH